MELILGIAVILLILELLRTRRAIKALSESSMYLLDKHTAVSAAIGHLLKEVEEIKDHQS